MNNKIKKKLKGKLNKEVIQKIVCIGNSILEMVIAIKSRQPLYLGHSAISMISALGSFTTNDKNVDEQLTEMGLTRVCVGMEKTIYKILSFINPSSQETLKLQTNDEFSNDKIIIIDIEDISLYFYNNNNQLDGLYVEDEEKFRKIFSNLLTEKYGKYISFEIIEDGTWPSYFKLKEIEMPTEQYCSILKEQDYYNNVMKIKNFGLGRSSLFYGPPGSGKTLFSARIADMFKGRLLIVGSEILDHIKDHHISLLDIFILFHPAVILFDDLDRLESRGLNLLLGFFEQLNKQNKSSLIIGTVNDLDALPDALKRPGRFDEIIHFDAPSKIHRKEIIKLYLDYFGTRLADNYVDEIVELTEGLTPAYLREIALRASIISYDNIPDTIKQMKSFCKSLDNTETLEDIVDLKGEI